MIDEDVKRDEQKKIEPFQLTMAAAPPRLLPAKQPHLPDQRTPEQRYWRSFKVPSLLKPS